TGQDLGPHDAAPSGAVVGVSALDGGPAAHEVDADGVLAQHVDAELAHDRHDDVEPVVAAQPGLDAAVGAGGGELVEAAAAVLPAAVVGVVARQQPRLVTADGLQPQRGRGSGALACAQELGAFARAESRRLAVTNEGCISLREGVPGYSRLQALGHT